MIRVGFKLTDKAHITKMIGECEVRITPEYTDHIGDYLQIRIPIYVSCRSCSHTDEEGCDCKECGGRDVYPSGNFTYVPFSFAHTKELYEFLTGKLNLASKRAWNEEFRSFMT